MTKEESDLLPYSKIIDTTTELLWIDATDIDKDAREQLAISLQLHHIDTTGKVYINSGFTAQNGLVGGPGLNDGIRVAHLRIKPFNQNIIDLDDILSFSSSPFDVSITSIRCPKPQNTSVVTSAAHAVLKWLGNYKYEVLYWVNEETESMAFPDTMYINFSDTY